MISKMCRNVVHFPDGGDIPDHFVKTLISQCHLCPLPLHSAPIYWNYDHALRIYPLPDVIVCADKYNSYSMVKLDCTIFNPGSFSINNFNFKMYRPAAREVEDCEIENE